ncbi:MAG: sigma-70 family RNA polymerase sigma factor [Isosphaeraceae bacterium]|nr:sigma-70 family RNA polymerase sigma factor [Isosphaeraceae bacterium]
MSHRNEESNGSERPSPLSTSRSLLGLAREGDATAWDRLSTLYAPLVFHWCRLRGLREADAADVVQDVFQAVATHLGPFRKHDAGDTFRGWLRTITENKIRDHFRRSAHEAEAVGGTELQHRLAQVPAPSGSGSAPSDEDWDGEFLRRALDVVRPDFEERTWQAFWRTVVDGQPPVEVAVELAMSAGAMRVAKCRVLKRLRQVIGEDLSADDADVRR